MTNEQIKNYVARQLTEQEKILSLYVQSNGKKHPRRYFFSRIEKHIESFLTKGSPRWITIPGLRGVGKTTILAQIFFQYSHKFNSRVLYVSLDEVVNKMGGDLFNVLDAYESLLGESFHSLKDNILLLIDEVHFDPKWQDALKTLYDKSRRAFVLSTGSSATAINRNSDAKRRFLTEKMPPLKFTEYTMLSGGITPQKGLENKIREILFESDNADDLYKKLQSIKDEVRAYWQKVDEKTIEKYIRYYSLPSVLPHDDPFEIYQILNSTLDRIIQEDFPGVHTFSSSVLSKISQLLYLIASSDVRSVSGFAKDLQNINEKTLTAVFRALEDAELLLRVYPFSSSAPKRVRKPSKYLFFAPSLRAALIHTVDPRAVLTSHKGKLLEDAVSMHLHSYISGKELSFGYDDAQGGADLIIGDKKKIVIEVGWNKNKIDQALKTMKDIQGDYGLLITNTPTLKKDRNVVTIPFEYFFLL